MREEFTLNDIKAGMLVVVKHYDSGNTFMSQVYDTTHGLCVSTEKYWFPLSSLSVKGSLSVKDLKDGYREIVEVWDICSSTADAHRIETIHRNLLWKRREPVKLTIKQIENLLGYEIEVVAENE